MDGLALGETLEDERLDHIQGAIRRASNCLSFAVLTPEPLAAELIDKAIAIRVASRTTMPPLA